jgi:hypothetical protein
MGRPTSFTEAHADQICEQLSEGVSLRKICKRPGMPNISTVFRWLGDDRYAKFRDQYARAREAQADTLADEIIYLADTPKVGTVTTVKAVTIDGASVEEVTTKKLDMIGHRRLQVDARKWLAAKLAPKKYGDRLELGGEVGLKTVSARPLTEDEWSAKHAPA